MFYIIYQITNLINGKIYVGFHKTNNLDDSYMGSGKKLIRAIKKYGVERFKKEYLYFCETYENMLSMEADIVNEEFVLREDTYNIVIGGGGGSTSLTNGFLGKHHNKKSKELKSILIKEYHSNMTLEERKRINQRIKDSLRRIEYNHATFSGRKHRDESKKMIGKENSKHQKGSGNSQFGTCWIYSLEKRSNKKIRNEDLNCYLEQGWIAGRKMKF